MIVLSVENRFNNIIVNLLLMINWFNKSFLTIKMLISKIINDHNQQFCVPSNYPDFISYFNLIDWTCQYVNSQSVFVDLGDDYGFYSIVLSNCCKNVYTNMNDYLAKSIELNNITNIKPLDLSILNVSFLKITSKVNDYENLLKHNNYPPFIFNGDNHDYIKSLFYNIHPINGYPDMFLASDNPIYKTFKLSMINNDLKTYEDIILSALKPLDERQHALFNAFIYMKPLPYTNKINLNCPMGKRVPNNPSIIQIDNGYLCNIRASNYVYNPNFQFLEGNIHLSDHHLLTLDENFKITKTVILKDTTNNIYYDSFVKGIDDLRLINNHQFICSHGNFNNHKTIQQCLGQYDIDGNVTSLIPLPGPEQYRHEKNWLPFYDHELVIIYMIHPFTLYKIVDNKMIKIKEIKLSDHNLDQFRGSAPPIPYNNGWLCTTHQVVNLCYFHRFVWFNQDFTEIKYSVPFYFEHKGIEFNLGMCHSKKGLLLTYSVLDNNAKLITIDYKTVDDYLL